MKNLISTLVLVFFSQSLLAVDGLIHPLDFTNSQAERNKVIEFIKNDVKQKYTSIGMGDASTLRMMENEELNAFKELMKVKNRKLLDHIMSKYCSINMCNYTTFLMMYNEELAASKKELTW